MSRLFILFATLFLFSAPGVHAQTADVPEKSPETEIVADVSIADAVVSQNDNVFSVTFTLSNGDRAQSSVRIGASLFPVDSSPFLTPVYQTVMDDTIALAQNSSRERTIQVSLPEYLSGQYDLFLEARNESGMVLSLAKAGTVTLSGDESFVELKKDTCFLSVGDEEEVSNRYDLEQGVDVSLEEKLVLHCDVVNRSDETLTVTPTYAFFFRTVFGDSVPARVVSDETYSISAGELQQLAFSIPLTLEPQAYDVTVALSNNQKVPSNEVTAHFVLQGQSATIQSVTMDKTSYRSGENAVVQVYLSGSADNFPDSRGGASFNSVATVKISLGSGSKECGETQTKQVDLSKDKSVSVSVATQIDCLMPTVSVSVADAQGNVLASENYNFTPEDVHNVSPDAKKESGSRSNSFSLVLQIGIVVFLAGFSAFFFWKKRKSSISVFVLGFLLFSGIFFSQGEVLAATSGAAHLPYDAYCDQCDPPGWIDHTTSLFASIPKSVYSPGEKVNIYGGVSYAVCTNSAKWGRWRVTNSWDSSWSYELNGQGGPTAPEIRTIHTDVSAPTVPGTYTVYVRWYDPRGYPAWYNPVTGTWRYDVSLRGKWDGTIPLTFVVGGPAIGSFDGVSTSGCKVRGWAFDPDNPSTSINVHVYRDGPAGSGTFVMSCSANLSRSDVNSYYGISGYHGFDCSLPSSYQGTGSHNLYIHAIDINGSPNNVISNSPKSLSCSAPAVNGSCGTAAKSYVYNATRYTGSFCSSGTASPSSPAFPAQGGLRTWTCQGSNGGSTRSCTATRQSVPTPTLTLQASPSSVSYNSSSTLSWSSTNTTSCTAFSGWTGSKATSGSESTGNLTTSQTYTLSCTGPGGSITRSVEVNVGPSVPAVLPPVCSADGTSAQVRWTWPSGATSFALRINDTSNGWTGTCSSVNSGDVCGELSTNSYVKTTIPGRQYQVWVHAFANGVYSPASTVYTFSCPGPVTVTGRIYDQTTGQGVANITIPACANNPGTTTDVNGNYFFQVPFGQGFCIRPTMSIPFGWAGPILTGLPVVQQAQKTYEWQVAGVNLGDPVCLTNPSASGCTSWKQWDRAVDNGYDFMYTSPPPTLAICSSSCGSGSSALSSFTLGVNSTRTIYTCFGPGTGDTVCQNGSSTFSSWLIGNSSVADISPSSGSQTVVTGRSHQNSPTTLGASFSSGGQNYTASSSVSVICTPSCGDRSQKCSGQTYADSCGTVDACQGTRDCSSGAGDYKEVAP